MQMNEIEDTCIENLLSFSYYYVLCDPPLNIKLTALCQKYVELWTCNALNH